MAASAASAAFEAATVQTAVAFDAGVPTEGRSTDRRAFRVGRACATESDVSTAATAADRATDALTTIEPAAALGSSRAATTFIAAAVQRSIAGNAIVVAEDGPSGLAAFARTRALPAQADGPAVPAPGTADSTHAEQAATADGVPIAPAAAVVAAVEHAVGVDPVRGADRGSR